MADFIIHTTRTIDAKFLVKDVNDSQEAFDCWNHYDAEELDAYIVEEEITGYEEIAEYEKL